MAAIVALVAATKTFGIINIWKWIARNHRTQFPSRPIKSALINHLPVAKTLRQQATDLRRSCLPPFVLTRFLYANRYPPTDQVRGHASLENALDAADCLQPCARVDFGL